MRNRFYLLLLLFFLILSFSYPSNAQQEEFFPLKDIKPGLKGVGKTVLSGTKIDEFNVEIVGVEQVTPDESPLIIAEISGGPKGIFDEIGAIGGMSGSPIYINEKLLGALAYSYGDDSKNDKLIGITPIQRMLDSFHPLFFEKIGKPSRQIDLKPLKSPVFINTPPNKFSELETIKKFFENQGLEVVLLPNFYSNFPLNPSRSQENANKIKEKNLLRPGSSINVHLTLGAINIFVNGTVTYIDDQGQVFYGFGHKLLNTGISDLPVFLAEIGSVFKGLFNKKIPTRSLYEIGAVRSDNVFGIIASLQSRAYLFPVTLSINSAKGSHQIKNFFAGHSSLSLRFAQFLLPTILEAEWGDATPVFIAVAGQFLIFQKGKLLTLNFNNHFGGLGGPQTLIKEFPFDALKDLLKEPLYALYTSGFPFAIHEININIFLMSNPTFWEKELVVVNKKKLHPGEKFNLHIVIRKISDPNKKMRLDVPLQTANEVNPENDDEEEKNDGLDNPALGFSEEGKKIIRDYTKKLKKPTVPIFIQSGNRFEDQNEKENSLKPESLETLIDRLNKKMQNSQNNRVYVQIVWPQKSEKPKKENPASDGKDKIEWYETENIEELKKYENKKSQKRIELIQLPPISGLIDIDEKIEIQIVTDKKTETPPTPADLSKAKPKKHFLKRIFSALK